jgi:hypothetical protein
VATNIARLDIEYQQAITGTGDTVASGVLAPLRDEKVALQQTMDDAPWLGAARRRELLDTITAAEVAAKHRVPLEQFRSRLTRAADLIRAELVT